MKVSRPSPHHKQRNGFLSRRSGWLVATLGLLLLASFGLATQRVQAVRAQWAAPLAALFTATSKPEAAKAAAVPLVRSGSPLALAVGDLEVYGPGQTDPIGNGNTTPSSINGTDFGSVNVASGSVKRTFTITNHTQFPINLVGTTPVTTSGDHPSDFTVTQPRRQSSGYNAPLVQPRAGAEADTFLSLSSNESVLFDITFDPSATGLRTATISIAYAASGPIDNPFTAEESPTYTFAIQGTGAAPEIIVMGNRQTIANGDTTPITEDGTEFGNVNVANGSVAHTFTITNNSLTNVINLTGPPAVVETEYVTIGGTHAGDFKVTQQPRSEPSLSICDLRFLPLRASTEHTLLTLCPRQSVTFIITFDPTATGLRTATVSIPYEFAGTVVTNTLNATTYTHTFAIQGTGDASAPTPPLTAQVGDPAVCLDPGGLVGVEATVTNPIANGVALASSWTATLPGNLTAVPGTCALSLSPAGGNPGTCTIAANGGSLSWNGTLAAGQTVNIVYRTRLNGAVANGTQLCIDNQAMVGPANAALQYCFTVDCPVFENVPVSDTKAGSVLVFPYYTSVIGGGTDTRMTISNISNAASTTANQAYVHLFLIDGMTCNQADLFLCLTPNASFSFKASEYDPGNTGYVIAVAVDRNGLPVNNNVLIGNAFVTTPTLAGNYGAESFRANGQSFALSTQVGNTATLYFDHTGYDAVPRQFAVEIQSPVDVVGQQIVTAGLSGNLTTSQMTGAAQVGTGLAFNEQEKFTSFQGWLVGTCQARGTVTTSSPRVPGGLGTLIKTSQAGNLKFNIGAGVGLLLTPRGNPWTGIRTLHKTQTVTTTITIPIFVPVC